MEVGMNKIIRKEVESAGDYVLPDYMGDIKKILYSRARSMPVGKYVSGSDAEHSGVVEYEVLYADSDNRLTAVTASSDYSVSASLLGYEVADSFCKSGVSSFAARTTGPRKLTFRSIVSSEVLMSCDEDMVETLSVGEGEVSLEKKTVGIKSEVYEHIATAERELAEEIGRVNGIGKDDVEVILATADVRIIDARATEKGILIKGELIAELIRRVADAPPYSTKRAYPFEHTVEKESMPDAKLTASGVASSVAVGMAEEGEDTVLSLNAIIELEVYASSNTEHLITVDAYSTEAETENQYSTLEYKTLLDVATAEFHLDEKVGKEALGLSSVRDILISRADAEGTLLEKDHHSVKIGGDIIISGVACEINGDDNVVYTPFKHSFPFSYNVNIGCQIGANDNVECALMPIVADVNIDVESIYFKITVCVTLKASSARSVSYLSQCIPLDTEVARPCASRITVYYPCGGETLFDIAKKHHTTCEKLCIDNSISLETFAGAAPQLPKKLIIK